ncbi:DNA polymerase II [Bacterioplanoides sp. SCSIO 12839]|uniref:DNA polymerase II n=1 Tax=Bacterioplanoides sp. SCSIO 12839 TaxID=2829569 RepID=UPI0021077A5B|nr:DNA polymerase II [Bacterioplanoides sp. SCSIO 12839]UTW48806.1 DNA polymerase II [Bacterioplanoides sp. SCSIO 12839]
MKPMVPGFLLTSSWEENPTDGGTQLTFWWKTAQGAVRTVFPQPAICFIDQRFYDKAQSIAVTLGWPVRVEKVALQSFDFEPACACYMPHEYVYRWRDVLAEQDIICREVDIRPTDRYLMERFIYGAAELHGSLQSADEDGAECRYQSVTAARLRPARYCPSLKALSIDIETSFPKQGKPDQLFSIGFYAEDYQHVVMVGDTQQSIDGVELVDDEISLLQRFLDIIQDYDPDVMIGWNVVQFDFAFLRRKFLQHKIPFTLGRDSSVLSWRQSKMNKERVFMHIAGRVVLDGIDLLKNATYQFESFALDAVAEHFLGDRKLLHGDDRGGDIEHLFLHDKAALADYNLKDCELVWRIFLKADLYNFAIERSHMTGLTMDRMGGSVAAFENLYLPRLHRQGFVAPNIEEGYHAQKSPGGYVMDSRPGLFEHVLVLDFKSLYPSIIRTFKIDPMGLVEGVKVRTEKEEQDNLVPGFFDGVFHKSKNVLPDLIRQLGEWREQAKQQHNQALSQTIKVIMASCYGVLGSEGCRFYDTRLSSSITKRGHQIIQQSSDWIEQQGYDVIYGDTDSVFVWLKQSVSDQQADDIGKRLVTGLNQWWQTRLQQEFGIESYLEMEYETHYRRFFMPSIRGEETGSKKRYAGLVKNTQTAEPEMVFKGLEAVRTDWTPLARNFQKELYRRVFLNQPYRDWVKQQVQALLLGQLDDQLIYRKRLRRPLSAYQKNIPPHAQAAAKLEQWRKLQGLLPRFADRGGWIEYRIGQAGAQPLEITQAIDYSHYVEKQLMPVADAIFHFTGESFSEMAGQQMALF